MITSNDKIIVSVSGGETSAMMAYIIQNSKQFNGCDIRYVFANTSREDDRTLDFVNEIDKRWGLGITWVEAVVHHGEKVASTHRIVNYASAKRDGSVFEEVIAKYGIPNTAFPHCTRELKANPIKSFVKSNGIDNYKIAIGYRYDEPKRLNWEKENTQNHLYILPRMGITKKHVKAFFQQQGFSLGLKEHQGNCRLCYKKSERKLLSEIIHDPKSVEWINDMEIKYGSFIPEGRKKQSGDIFFFRNNESIYDLIEKSKEPFLKHTDIDFSDLSNFDVELDYQDECTESCEPF